MNPLTTSAFNLPDRLATKADPAALRSLVTTSVPTGRLEVPELTLHTLGDNLVPVQMENYYARQVDPRAAARAEFHRRKAQPDPVGGPPRPGR